MLKQSSTLRERASAAGPLWKLLQPEDRDYLVISRSIQGSFYDPRVLLAQTGRKTVIKYRNGREDMCPVTAKRRLHA